MCDQILVGKDRMARVNKEHIRVRGIVEHTYYEEYTEMPIQTYGLPSMYDDHHFCDFMCLEGFVEIRKKRIMNWHARKLQKIAEHETWNGRRK